MQMGLLCAVLGALTAAAFFVLTGGWWLLRESALSIGVGLIVLFVAAGYFGMQTGVYLCWRGNSVGLGVGLGIGLAFGCIACSGLAGSLFYILINAPQGRLRIGEIAQLLFLPTLGLMLFGGLPAVVLGVVYGLLTGMQLQKLQPIKYTDQHKL
jgi:hypothetical protein